ncbi:MAG: hypothetical protein WC120_01695 [Parcubacteria group bacterium]
MSVITEIFAFNKDEAEKTLAEFLDFVKKADSVEKAGESEENKFFEHFSELKDAYRYGGDDFLAGLENIYLKMGSVSALINSAMGDEQYMSQLGTLVGYFKLEQIDEYIPTKDSFIQMYALINDENLAEIAKRFSETDGYDIDEARDVIIDTFSYLKPLVRKLKEDAETVLVVSHDYDFPNVIPEEFDYFLQNRIEEIKNLIKGDPEIYIKLK